MAKNKDYLIDRVDQLLAIAEPTRLQIVSIMEDTKEASVSQIAEQLGRPHDSLYHHVRHLERVGLLIKVGMEKSARRPYAIYGLPGRRIRVNPENTAPRYRAALKKAARGVFRLAERLADAAFDATESSLVGTLANMRIQQLTVNLSTSDFKKVNEHLKEIDKLFLSCRTPGKGKRLYTITYSLTPTAKS